VAGFCGRYADGGFNDEGEMVALLMKVALLMVALLMMVKW
jgi:hypothetical protein